MHRSAQMSEAKTKSVSVDLDHVPVVDDVVVERLRALRDQVAQPGEDVLGELLSLFTRDTQTRVVALRAAVPEGRTDDRRSAAHALKGSAANIGAPRVAALAAHVEKNDVTGADIDRLEREVAEAVGVLGARLR